MERRSLLLILCFGYFHPVAAAAADEARINVRADKVMNSLTRYMTGACIEDVNHEIYGGIYSQMIFGESFQEPAPPAPLIGFSAFGGTWAVRNDVLWADGGAGPKLLADDSEFADGEAGVEVFFADERSGNAGLIIHVREAGIGADVFIGYEIALDPARDVLVVGRHHHNWTHIRDVKTDVPTGRWIPLAVRMAGNRLEIDVDGKTRFSWQDNEAPLPPGKVGLRTWQRTARFRNLWLRRNGATQAIAFRVEAESANEVSGMWRPVLRGTAVGRLVLEGNEPFVGRQSQRIRFEGGAGAIGIENQGLNRWGLSFQADRPYDGYLWARTEKAAELAVALESADGTRTYAQEALPIPSGGWQRLEFTLTPNATDTKGRFAILLKAPGSVAVGHAFLQPRDWGRFRRLPLRKDVVEGLIAQGLTVLRYGGSMVNAPEYRWKKMIGPRDRRPPYKGTWYPYSTNGWGIIDFLNLCEAAGFLAIPAFNMDETPQDMADFIEYVNGPAASPWGRRRVEDGHPEPYRLGHVQLGNEEAVDENYWRRFQPLAEAIWARDRNVIIVVGDFAYDRPIEDPYDFSGAPRIKSLAAHKKILDLANQHGREIWFDVHIWNNEPRQPDGLGGVPSFARALDRISPGARYKVPVFELNAGNHAVRRALANAHAINELERLGDMVPIVCSANCLQPYKQNDNGWDQGLLFLIPSQVWGQPPYYVTQMISRHYLPLVVNADFNSPDNALDVTAKKSPDGRILQLQVVNVEGRPVPTRVTIAGFTPSKPTAKAIVLSGALDDVNTPEVPDRIVPREDQWLPETKHGALYYTFAPYSFTILRLE